MHGGTRPGAGRKPATIDPLELEKLSSLHCSDAEVAAFFGVSVSTIEKRRKQPRFAAAMNRGRAKGRIAVRRAQMKVLEAGNATMGIWLGKQLLGQRDQLDMQHTGAQGGPVRVDLSKLTEEELEVAERLALAAARTDGKK